VCRGIMIITDIIYDRRRGAENVKRRTENVKLKISAATRFPASRRAHGDFGEAVAPVFALVGIYTVFAVWRCKEGFQGSGDELPWAPGTA